MNPEPEEDLEAFKKRINKQELKRARSVAAVCGISAIVAMISGVFAFFQFEAVEVQRAQVAACAGEVNEYKAQVEVAEQEMLRLNKTLEKVLKEAETARMNAEEQFKNANQKRK